MKPKKYYTEEEVIKLMISASKWGSHAYEMPYRLSHGCVSLGNFRRHRKLIMKDIIDTSKNVG